MERSDKQRKPVAIKNLSELKRFIQPGVEFKTLSQKNHPDLVGLTRVVTTVQTVCFYSKIKDQPNSRFSTDNGGKGFRTDFAKADAYIFDGTTVKVKDTRNKDRGVIYEFEFYDREQTMQEDTNMDRKMVNFIREQYPPGTRIRLNSMEDPYAPIAPGTEGEVDFVDDIGTIHMKWDNGRALGIVPGEDSFSVLPPKLTTLKLYMPLTADFYERSEYGDLEPESTMLDGCALRGYQDQIMAELVKNRMPEETERGLMPSREKQLPKLKALLEHFEVTDLAAAASLVEHIGDYILTPAISSPQEAAIDELNFTMDVHSAELLLPHVNLFAYGNEIIKDDNATLTSYGLLHREDYQPMQTPVQERFEMDTQQLT